MKVDAQKFSFILRILIIISMVLSAISILASSLMLSKIGKDAEVRPGVQACGPKETHKPIDFDVNYLYYPETIPGYGKSRSYGIFTCPGVLDSIDDDDDNDNGTNSKVVSPSKAELDKKMQEFWDKCCECIHGRTACAALFLTLGVVVFIIGIALIVLQKRLKVKAFWLIFLSFQILAVVFSVICLALALVYKIGDKAEDVEIFQGDDENPQGKFFLSWLSIYIFLTIIIIVGTIVIKILLKKSESKNEAAEVKSKKSQVSSATGAGTGSGSKLKEDEKSNEKLASESQSNKSRASSQNRRKLAPVSRNSSKSKNSPGRQKNT